MVMAFAPAFVGCLVKKGLQKGRSRAPQDPPWLRPWLPVTFVRTLNRPSKLATKSLILVELCINQLLIEKLIYNEGKYSSRKMQLQAFINRERG